MSEADDRPTIAFCLEYRLAERGGVSVLVEELIAGLASEFRIWLISPDSAEEIEQHQASKLLAGHIPFQLIYHPPKKVYRDQARSLVETLVANGVKLAHFHAGGTFGWGNRWPGASLPHYCKEAGLRVVWTDHLTEYPSAGYAWKGRRELLGRWLAPLARIGKTSQMDVVDAEIAVSKHDQAFLEREFPGGRARLRQVYHSRLDPSRPQPEAPREKLVLAVGHIAFRKGQDVLARAFLEVAEQYPDWRLTFLGHGGGDDCASKIRELCVSHAAGSRVELAGPHPRPMEIMARAAIFVQPSLEEALGLALQEAIFAGCPAIGTKVGGIPEVIDVDETGIAIPSGQVSSMAEALRRLMGDAELRARMSAKGATSIVAKGMTRDKMVVAHRDLYSQVLSAN